MTVASIRADAQRESRRAWYPPILAAVCAVWLVAAPVRAARDYVGSVSSALDHIEVGNTRDALAALKQAIAHNANDPLAHAALGLVLLCGGRADDAAKEFSATLELDADCAEAEYGLGLVSLIKGDLGQATTHFCSAQVLRAGTQRSDQSESAGDVQGSIEYVKALARGAYSAVEDDHGDEALQAINALALKSEGRWSEAGALLTRLQAGAARTGFGERIGCAMTFTRAKPVVTTGWPLKQSYTSPLVNRDKLTTVADSVLLKADLSRAQGVSMVMFFVDNKLVGMTNQHPFQYSWDTTRVANGPHVVRIRGCDADGMLVSEKSVNVVVRNKGSEGPLARVGGQAAGRAWARLWEALRLKPSAAAINYHLALCAAQERDYVAAAVAFERVMAADPDSADAEERLAAMYSSMGSHQRLGAGAGTAKRIALTFDDGPKDHTAELLDALNAKGVKATFFVVGKQAETFPNLIRRMKSEGHEIQNHTYSHRDLEYLSEREIKQEIFKTTAVVRSLTGERTSAVRPPGGHEGKKLPSVMKKFGMDTVMWTTNCSKLEGTTRRKVVDHVIATARPGAIVLMHNSEMVTLQALPEIIDRLRAAGYDLVTLSELTR